MECSSRRRISLDKGEIVNEFGDGTIYVMFSAVEVKRAVEERLHGE